MDGNANYVVEADGWRSITCYAKNRGGRGLTKRTYKRFAGIAISRRPAERTAPPWPRIKRTGSGLSVKTKTFLLGKRMGTKVF